MHAQEHSRKPRTIAVIGGGVIGLMSAWRLSRAGHAVHVFEKDRIADCLGQGASMAALGALMPLPPDKETPFARMQRASHALYPVWMKELEAESGVSTRYRACGRVQALYRDRDAQQAQELAQQFPEKRGYQDFTRLQQEKSFLYFGALGALTCHETAFVSPQHLLLALKKALLAQGAMLHENTQVISYEAGAAGVRLLCQIGTEKQAFEADAALVATGCGYLPPTAALGLGQVVPVKGEALDIRLHPAFAEKLGGTLYRSNGMYLVQAEEGVLRIGAADTKDARPLPSAQGMQHLFTLVQRLLNPAHYGLAQEIAPQETDILHHWAGLRPRLAQAEIPFVAADKHNGRLVYALGHYKTGIGFAPETARLACALLAGEKHA